ncbi:MAG TPA: FAD-linked oxidase C-terminal domain-containing protein [Pyrinomonadaceae bacterium]|nr:FAD-linked oxidase C-terminal domain-containing protein [Pyrinomonadaceae bacterium]
MTAFINNLRAIVGAQNVLTEPDELLVYECDGLPHHKYRPCAVVFPSSTEETSEVMRDLAKAGVAFTPRGAGTGLSGGALALNEGVVIELARMRKILNIDAANSTARVQPGVVNSHVSRAVAHLGLHYVPDPSSQPTCTIGGNLAENAGGIHCLKYGTTTDHVLGVRVVLSSGEVVDLGGAAGAEKPGYDLTGTFIGSEGTFGIATEATLRLVPIPPAVRTLLAEFVDVNNASHAVSAIIAAGVMPAALEMMDREIIRAVEASVFSAGLSLDVGAALLIELDGIEWGIDDEAERVKNICIEYGARSCRSAQDEAERLRLWAARKSAFGAVSRISPDSMIQDAVVPRSRLPEVLADAYRISAKYQLRLANVFHAGDGNLHPLICFDSRSPDQVHKVKEAGRELMETCVRAGGSITGEHGVGFDKRELLSLIFSETDMDTMLRVRAAFDPTGLCNPGKTIPMLRGCGEARAVAESGNGSSKQPEEVLPHAPIKSARTRSHKSFDRSAAQQRLLSIVGATNISADKFAPALLVTPESVDHVCEVMQLASSEQWTVLPAGTATWVNAGNELEPINVVVSTQKLTRVIEHEPADLIAIAEAGVTLRALNEELRRNGQWLPLDPPDDGTATIGGIVGTGLGGAQQFGYGAPRRHVIGMKVVRADGSLIKMGGRVVKNVAGYDLSKLFTGSYGTLGVIVEVNFKLRPVPFETVTMVARGDRQHLLECGRKVIASRLFPVAVELLSPGLGAAMGFTESDYVCLIKFDGSKNGVGYQAKTASDIIGASPNSGVEIVESDDSIWHGLASMPMKRPEDIVLRISVKPADLEPLISELETRKLEFQISIGTGGIRVFSQSADTADIGALRSAANHLGGSLVIENAPPEVKQHFGAWGDLGNTTTLMERIKQQLDPDRLLSPGRFSANI